jgi:hypothetical protein
MYTNNFLNKQIAFSFKFYEYKQLLNFWQTNTIIYFVLKGNEIYLFEMGKCKHILLLYFLFWLCFCEYLYSSNFSLYIWSLCFCITTPFLYYSCENFILYGGCWLCGAAPCLGQHQEGWKQFGRRFIHERGWKAVIDNTRTLSYHHI